MRKKIFGDPALDKVTVIGAGIAGLTAAYRLQKKGKTVTVLEASSRIGGRVCTDYVNGFVIDAGAQFLSTGYKNILSLVQELGLSQQLVEVSPRLAIVKDGRPRRVHPHQPHTLFTSGLLSLSAWTNFIYRSALAAFATRQLSLADYSAWSDFDTVNTPEWYRAKFGNDVYNYIIEPALEGLYFQSPVYTSQALPMAISMFAMRQHKILTLKDGLAILPQKLAQTVQVHVNSPVSSLELKQDKVIVRTPTNNIEADHVIVATPASAARTLYFQNTELERELMRTDYSATVNVAIGIQNKLACLALEQVYGILIPGVERRVIAAIAIGPNKCKTIPPDCELLNVMLADKPGKEFVKKSDEEILAAILTEIELYFPGLCDLILFTRVYRWPQAEPRSPIGRSKAIKSYRKNNGHQKILLAGDYLSMPFTEGAVESGLWAANQILNSMNTSHSRGTSKPVS